jgi:hypothetical protein
MRVVMIVTFGLPLRIGSLNGRFFDSPYIIEPDEPKGNHMKATEILTR